MTSDTVVFISPLPLGDKGYPHIDALIHELKKSCYVHYIKTDERGYLLGMHKGLRKPRSPSQVIRDLWRLKKTICSILKIAWQCFFVARINGGILVCIDNYIYAICSLIAPSRTVLWSLDFVGPDNNQSKSFIQKVIRLQTGAALLNNGALIIQDEERKADLLMSLAINSSSKIKTFYLPVSLQEVDYQGFPKTFANKRPLLLQHGGINSYRSASDQLIANYNRNFSMYDLYLHGYISSEITCMLNSIDRVPFLSSIALRPSQIPKLVMKCDIGVIFYNVKDLNFRSMANASNQLVEFLRCGKPVISFGNQSLAARMDELQVGVSIDNIDELGSAIIKIMHNYEYYSQNAIKSFASNYDISKYSKKLLRFLKMKI